MNTRLINLPTRCYVECSAGDGFLDSEAIALDLVVACGEGGTQALMIQAGVLTEAFFNLRTGLAGSILQKFANYHIRAAWVLTPELVNQGRFREMALESNRGNQFRFFYDRVQAEQWLAEVNLTNPSIT